MQVKNEVVLLTNTVKYELQATSETFAQMKAQDDEYQKKYIIPIEPQWGC
jgi:Holliday junction resolvasome RuvABC DNA-binding subunit